MFVQTDNNGRIIAMMESTFENSDGEIKKQDTTGFFEFEIPDDFDFNNMFNYVIESGKLIFSESDESKSEKEENNRLEQIKLLPDAVADISKLVSDNTSDVAMLSDALADLSEIVSYLVKG